MSGGGKMGLSGMMGNTSNFVDPAPFVQYEQQQTQLAGDTAFANKGMGGSTNAVQGSADPANFGAAQNMFSALTDEQKAQMSEESTLNNYTSQADALTGNNASQAGFAAGLGGLGLG